MAVTRALLLLMGLSGVVVAQQPAAESAARHAVTGTVVNARTGEPLPKALVRLQTSEGGTFSAFTDSSGHFSFEDVPDGRQLINCQKPGFFPPGSESAAGRRFGAPGQESFGSGGEPVNVSASTVPVVVKLMPAGSIMGRVTDEQGEAIENANVQVLAGTLIDGEKQWQNQQIATTDEDGNYEVSGLLPGSYRLHLNMHLVPAFDALRGASGNESNQTKAPLAVYPAEYYPAGSDAASAQAVGVEGGQAERADFTVRAVPAFRIRGTVSAEGPGCFIQVEDANGNNIGMTVAANPRTGTWAMPAVPAGEWTVIALSNGLQQLAARQTIAVAGPIDIRLQLQPTATIPIRVLPADEDGFGGQLFLSEESGDQRRMYGPSSLDGGALSFFDVLPGHYRLGRMPAGSKVCIDSVRSGDLDVGRDGLTVEGGGTVTPVEVTLSTSCGTMHVKVNKPATMQTAAVLVLSDNSLFKSSVLMTGSDGTVQSGTVPPGTYRLYAFDTINGLEYANAEALRSFNATELRVEPKQDAEVSLDLITRAGNGVDAGSAQ